MAVFANIRMLERLLIPEPRTPDRVVANVSGIQLGLGGVWLCATPYLLFIPDRNRDDVPDGPPEVVLDGWDLTAKHKRLQQPYLGHGWLYGCNGILSNSKVGKPRTPADSRVTLNCGVWRGAAGR